MNVIANQVKPHAFRTRNFLGISDRLSVIAFILKQYILLLCDLENTVVSK